MYDAEVERCYRKSVQVLTVGNIVGIILCVRKANTLKVIQKCNFQKKHILIKYICVEETRFLVILFLAKRINIYSPKLKILTKKSYSRRQLPKKNIYSHDLLSLIASSTSL